MKVSDSINSIPELEVYKKELESMYAKSRTLKDLQEIGDLFYIATRINNHLILFGPNESINKLFIFRCREISDKTTASVIARHSYPPNDCTPHGRLNIKNNPVFYGSDTLESALFESRPKNECTRYVGVWGINKPDDTPITSFLADDLPGNNPWKIIATRFQQEIIKLAEYTPAKREQIKFLFEWANRLFQREEAPYPLTSWMGYDILYDRNVNLPFGKDFKNAAVDLIIYPSFTTKYHTCNIAISKEFVDKYMKLLRVYQLYVHDVKEESCKYNLVEIGDVVHIEIIWRPPTIVENIRGVETPKRLVDGMLYWQF